MRVVVDLDGVVYQWSDTARYLLMRHRGVSLPEKESPYWNYIPDHISKEDWQWLWSEGVRLGLFRYGHIVKGAADGIQTLAEAGHKLLVVTHRPAAAVQDTVDWLNYTKFPWSEPPHIFTKEESKTKVDADVLIDDKPENIKEWDNAGRIACLFRRRWNETADLPERILVANGWSDVEELFGEGGVFSE